MGAQTFYEFSSGKTAGEAFSKAVKNAAYQYGHSGYTGSIAEKSNFSMVTEKIFSSSEACDLAESLISTDYSDKWGPAGCIQVQSDSQQNIYLFFGWASS